MKENLITDNSFIIKSVIGIMQTEAQPSIAISINDTDPVPSEVLAQTCNFLPSI